VFTETLDRGVSNPGPSREVVDGSGRAGGFTG
jgi:hypothetical protein